MTGASVVAPGAAGVDFVDDVLFGRRNVAMGGGIVGEARANAALGERVAWPFGMDPRICIGQPLAMK